MDVHEKPEIDVVKKKPSPTDRSCEVGLLECGENADCKPRENSKSMVGTCECKEGFVFDSGGTCVPLINEKTVIFTVLLCLFLARGDKRIQFLDKVVYM